MHACILAWEASNDPIRNLSRIVGTCYHAGAWCITSNGKPSLIYSKGYQFDKMQSHGVRTELN